MYYERYWYAFENTALNISEGLSQDGADMVGNCTFLGT